MAVVRAFGSQLLFLYELECEIFVADFLRDGHNLHGGASAGADGIRKTAKGRAGDFVAGLSGAVVLFQIFQFCQREYFCFAWIVIRFGTAGHFVIAASGGHIFLHIPDFELCDRCVPG